MPTAPTPNNAALLTRARQYTAAEGYDIDAKPPFVTRAAQGAWVTDADGRRILDLTSANGTVVLGHRHPKVVQAVVQQLTDTGHMFPTTLSELRIDLAERLCTRYPARQKALFYRTGSEATTAAVRLARAATGRQIILSSGYHGWHDWHLRFQHAGFDPHTNIVHFGYNLDALRRLLESIGEHVAGVIVTPEVSWYPPEHFRNMATICQRHGTPFILDEVMSGFRFGPGGLHGTGDVPVDLMVLSKGLGNGHSLAAVLGRQDLIDAHDRARLAGTYNRETTGMAAAMATLDVIDTEPVYEVCLAHGAQLRQGFADALTRSGLAGWVSGEPMMFKVVFASDETGVAVADTCFEQGLYLERNGTQMINYAFGQEEIQFAVDAFTAAVTRVAAWVGNGERGQGISDERRTQYARGSFGGIFDYGEIHDDVEETIKRVHDDVR
jgi:glutamate-1-semialdehyde aminotransferase